ncbi:MAG: SAM-dependent chlorinase/fluorinase [Gammaproteobacteria bacterium]|nr:SAM-dependent chlorinase/fluorinase [Gammaproteobacteria bacterium]
MAEKKPQRVALFTDFGETGPYLGQMEAVLHAAGVTVPLIRLLSDAPLCNPRASAYLLSALARHMPESTLFLAVVDPGVGGSRLPLVLRAAGHWFVGPDNGLFSQLAQGDAATQAEVIKWRPQSLSSSFHGRDLFAPVAAACVDGRRFPTRPVAAGTLVGADWPRDLAEVIYVDRYGNCLTGLRADAIDDGVLIIAGGHQLRHAGTFSEVPPGRPFWYRNSLDLIEIAVNLGSAEALLALAIGTPIECR